MTENTIDMATLARFAILPGASDLMEAFAAIPPGPMRDAVIHLARTTAGQFTGAHGAYPMPDPMRTIDVSGQRRKPLALTNTRTGREAPSETPQMLAVKMRVADTPMDEVIEATGLSKQQIYQAVHEARKAGVKFPPRKPNPGGPAAKVWHTTLDDLTGQGKAAMERAAAVRGISPQDYLDRRLLALELAQAGHGYETILDRTGERDSKVVSAWLSAARGAGHAVPYVTFVQHVDEEPEPTPEPEPEPVAEAVEPAPAPYAKVFKDIGQLTTGAAAGVAAAAARRNMTIHAYQELRESIVVHRRQGMAPAAIQRITGEAKHFVKDTLDAAIARGVQFPPLYQDTGAEAPELAPSVSLKQA